MINAILNGILKFILVIVDSIMTPINVLLSTLFPNINSYLGRFIYVLEHFIVNFSYYFLSILPVNTRWLVITYLQFLVSYYTIYGVVWVVYAVFKLIKNLKIW